MRPNLRALWLLDDRLTFLNHGSFGAVPRAVFDEQTEWRRRIEADPVEIISRRRIELLADAKRPLAAWLNMRPDDFGFVTNATAGINAVLRSLTLRPGDELLTTTHVYNAVRKTMQYVARRGGASYREVDVPLPVASADQIARTVLGALADNTRLLVIDHVTSPTALVFPVKQIVEGCAERNVDVLIDGAHAPGMLPLDVPATGAAFYTGNLHKWAAAPKGTGFLWARPDRQHNLHPLIISHYHDEGFVPEFNWQGTRDFSAWLSVPRALQFMSDLGWDDVRRHNHQLATWAQSTLCERWNVEPVSPLDGSLLGSMATLRLPDPLASLSEPQLPALQQRLHDEFRLEVPIMRWSAQNLVRPCCQVYTTPQDIERLADVVSALALESC